MNTNVTALQMLIDADVELEHAKLAYQTSQRAIGQLLSMERSQLGIGRKELAASIGISTTHLRHLELGERLWHPAWIRRFTEALQSIQTFTPSTSK